MSEAYAVWVGESTGRGEGPITLRGSTYSGSSTGRSPAQGEKASDSSHDRPARSGEPGQTPDPPFAGRCSTRAQQNRLAGVWYHAGDTSATDQQVGAYTYLADGRRDALATADVERVAQAVAEEVQGQ